MFSAGGKERKGAGRSNKKLFIQSSDRAWSRRTYEGSEGVRPSFREQQNRGRDLFMQGEVGMLAPSKLGLL